MPQAPQTFNHKALMRIAVVMAFIQFTNALEYMAFNPVFAFMAADFAVPVSFSGYVSGMYTLAAVISGVIAFYQIDRFDKKRFLMTNMALLGLLTLLSTFTTSFNLLLVLRFCAGLVGGTTMGVGISILINNAPPNLRGKMLATVIASFSVVSIVGTPAILFLCTNYGWHIALWSISILCLLALPLIVSVIPKDPASLNTRRTLPLDSDTLLFASSNALVQFSPMLVIPVLVPLMTQQLGASPDLLPWLFFGGGIAGYLAKNDRRVKLPCICLDSGNWFNHRLYSEFAHTKSGLPASCVIYYVVSRRILQSSGVVFGSCDAVSRR
jgi:predicted MFS family arabinose efflux permease